MIKPQLPDYDYSLLIRTDFSDDAAWDQVCKKIQALHPKFGFIANVDCINDQACAGVRPGDIETILPQNHQRRFVFIVDTETITDPGHPLLVVDLVEQPGKTFRVIPAEAWGPENNLRLAKMDFSNFAEALDPDGVFRGFAMPS